MSEPNILLARVDNRLIHGQVATQWVSYLDANCIIVVNDDAATNRMRQGLMGMAAPADVKVVYFSVKQAIEEKASFEEGDKALLLVETPADALALVEGGVKIERLNVGIMHMKDGKHQVSATVAVDDDDVAALKALRDKGVELELRRVPSVPPEDVEKLFA